MKIDLCSFLVTLVLWVCWLAFAAIFLFRKKPRRAAESKRDPSSRWGIFIQGIAFALVWGVRRPLFTPIRPMPRWLDITLGIVADATAIVSVWICFASVRALGKQWAYVARLVEDHKLVTSGPYRVVRNPIYLGMFGMMVATGISLGRWWVLPIALIVFLIGTSIRIRSEERLLRGCFGAEFEEYSRRVPALFPRVFS
jgi:protein-S-isoprenylcysteine O-methyltransferase Ste14